MILGITGSFGAGKGAAVVYLTAQRGFHHYSASGFITEEIERRGLPVDRDSMTLVANELRAAHGPSFVIDSLYERAQETGGDAVIESLRAVAEVRRIKELGGKVIGITATPEIRYDRALKRGSEKDNVSFDKWVEQEKAEMNPNDPTKQDIFGALEESTVVINNDGSLEELYAKLDTELSTLH